MEHKMTVNLVHTIHTNNANARTKPKRKHDVIPDVSTERWIEIKEKFPHFPYNTDMIAERKESPFRLPEFCEEWLVQNVLNDPRDAIMASLIMSILCTSVPLTIALYIYPSHFLGAFAFGFTFFTYCARFILLLHYTEHRKLFRDPYHNVMRYFLPCVMCLLFGIPPGMYRLHHIVMHHLENNVFDKDLSSTEPYQRDNILHFLIYFCRHWTHIILLPLYAIRKGLYNMAIGAAAGSISWVALIAYGLSLIHI